MAKGLRRTYYTESTGEGKHWKLKPEEEWIYHKAPEVVSEELWEECNAIIKRQSASRKPRGRQVTYLFSGVLYCHCGNKMYKPKPMKKYQCHKCRNKIPETDLETIFVVQLKRFHFDEAEVATATGTNNSSLLARERLFATSQKGAEELATEMKKPYRLYQDDVLTPSTFGELYEPLKRREAELGNEIARLQGELDALRIDSESIGVAVEDSRILYSQWPSLLFESKRIVVETVVERITVGQDDVSIKLAFVPYREGVSTTEA